GSKGHDVLVARLKEQYGFRWDTKVEDALIVLAGKYSPVDSIFQNEARQLSSVLFHISDKAFTTGDFADYLSANRASAKYTNQSIFAEKKKAFVDAMIIAYEDSQLEHKYADFRNLIREYHDGILLFEVSNKEVWERASQDIDGLNKYFKHNKKSYRWDAPKFKGFVVECMDEATAKAARRILKKTPADSAALVLRRELNNDSVQFVRVQKGLYSQGENQLVDIHQFKSKEELTNDTFPVTFVYGKKLKKGPESYEDVRGLVTADYQTYLEKEWILELKQKNTVEINQDVLKTVKPL
ncbi:MAG: peptidylprolyl isomerase, partial [Bacteroidales bacterium]